MQSNQARRQGRSGAWH